MVGNVYHYGVRQAEVLRLSTKAFLAPYSDNKFYAPPYEDDLTDSRREQEVMESQLSRIVFDRRLPKEARREEDDWGGLSEASARRRIQNRLHQRSYRRKRALEREAKRASAACRPRKPASLAARPSVPAGDRLCIDPDPNSRASPPAASDKIQQVPLRAQTVFQQITSASPVPECAALLSNRHVRRLHHYARSVLWPSFKHYSLETNESLTSSFFRLSMVDDLLLNSFIWPAAIALSMHLPHTSAENDAVMLASQNEAVKSIREHINRNDVSDSVIFAVLALTIRDTNPLLAMQEDVGHSSGAFDPPLRSMGWLQYLSRLRWTASHMYALKRLVAARGGLRNITTPGVAEQVQSTDILQASLSLTTPNFTLSCLYEHVLQNHVKMIRPPRKRIEDVFPAVTDIDFLDVLLDMRMYCRQLEKIVDEVEGDGVQALSDSSVTWETNVARNIIQYRLLRLPRYQHDDEELCRLGALIFSFGVIYPVARRRPLHTLIAELRTALESHKARLFSRLGDENAATQRLDETDTSASMHDSQVSIALHRENPTEMLLWIAILGALAAKGTDHETFFVDLVRTLSLFLEVDDFIQLRDIMRRHIWLDRACDTGALKLWQKLKGEKSGDVALPRNQSALQRIGKQSDMKEMCNLICTGGSA